MPRHPGPECTLCAHPRRAQIERAYLSSGRSQREVAAEYQVSSRSLNNHFARGHVRRAVQQALQARPRREDSRAGMRILDTLDEYRERINRALDATDRLINSQQEEDGSVRDPGVLLAAMREQMSAIREASRLLEITGKITGELDASKFNLYVVPQWIQIRDLILNVLAPYPEVMVQLLNAANELKLGDRAFPALEAPEPVEAEAEIVSDEAN